MTRGANHARGLLPRLLPDDRTFEVHAFQGKADLLGKPGARLPGYAQWLPADWRLFVIVDRDDEDCRALKQRLEALATRAGLVTRSQAGAMPWQLVNRIAIEELESWYFGDWDAVKAEYPRVPALVAQRQGLRDPDAIAGRTWEAFERVMRKHGYFRGGLAKIEAARSISRRIGPDAQPIDELPSLSCCIAGGAGVTAAGRWARPRRRCRVSAAVCAPVRPSARRPARRRPAGTAATSARGCSAGGRRLPAGRSGGAAPAAAGSSRG